MTLLSVDRTLAVLDVLVDREDVGISELAEQLGVAPSTAHRILETLIRRMFVTQDADTRRYRLGPRMRTMSHEIDLIARSRHLVRAVGRQTGMTVHLCVLNGSEVRYVHHWTPPTPRAIGSRVGHRLPAHTTSAGKALLSLLPADRIRRTYPMPTLPQPTPAAIGQRQALLEELLAIRRAGYARNIEESEPGVAGFARSIPHPNQPIALTVSARLPELRRQGRTADQEKRIVEQLALASDELHHALG